MDTEDDEDKVNVKGGMLRRSFQVCDLTEQQQGGATKLKGSNSMALIQQNSSSTVSNPNNTKLSHGSVVVGDSERPLRSFKTMDDSRRLFDSSKDIPSLNEAPACAIITDAALSGWKFVCDSCNSQVFQSYYQDQPVLVKSFDVYRSLEEEETLIDFESVLQDFQKLRCVNYLIALWTRLA